MSYHHININLAQKKQSFDNSAEAQQLLSVDHSLTHYVDISVSKLQGEVEVVRKVAQKSDELTDEILPGGGIEIVTKNGIDISDIIEEIDFKSLKQN
jgi:hypothetical protein